MKLQLASASGNVFGYFWVDEVPPTFDGPAWARVLCPRGIALGLDGIFLLHRPVGESWHIEHWDADGSHSFCSNGSRAAFGLLELPAGAQCKGISCGIEFELRKTEQGVAIKMPEGEVFGLRPLPLEVQQPAAFGYIGNPQLVVEVDSVAAIDLAQFAPPLRHHPSLAGGTNVNVVERIGPGEARIRSWERGVEGETLCCGTGCGVSAAWLAERTGLNQWVFHTLGGEPVTVTLEWAEKGHWKNLWLSGPVRRLGVLELDPSLL